jgi:OOP family OmpA-OmpF porin
MRNRLAATSLAVVSGLLLAGPAAAQAPQKYTVHFGETDTKLTKDSEAVLGVAVEAAQECSEPVVSLVGHDDATLAPTEALALSLKRAEIVKVAMMDGGGINSTGFIIKGQGRQQPVVQTADGVAERANRRVEISVSCK